MTETTNSTTISTAGATAPAVRWEPCRAFHDDPVDADLCAACGWAPDDHELLVAA